MVGKLLTSREKVINGFDLPDTERKSLDLPKEESLGISFFSNIYLFLVFTVNDRENTIEDLFLLLF